MSIKPLTRKSPFVLLGVLLALQILRPAAAAEPAPSDLDARVNAVHSHVLTLDSHVDVIVPGEPSEYGPGQKDQASLELLRKGGIDAVAFAIAVGPGPRTPEGVAAARAEADKKLALIQAFVKDHPKEVALALSADDVRRIHAQGRIAVIESFLNARSLGHNLDAIDELHRQGVRLFAFTHAGNNDWADSSRPTGEPAEEFHGLSPLGKQAVARLNRLGVIIDVSQLTPAGVLQVLELSKAPVVASHSAVRALVDNTRNLSDRELDAIKAHGGVVQVPPFNTYLVRPPADYKEKVQVLRKSFGLKVEYPATPIGFIDGAEVLSTEKHQDFIRGLQGLTPRATVKEYVDHIDYIAKRIGVDHVGIGTDFNHGSGITGFADEGEARNVTRELLRRGYTEEQIGKIWGGNFLRVFAEVQTVAHTLSK